MSLILKYADEKCAAVGVDAPDGRGACVPNALVSDRAGRTGWLLAQVPRWTEVASIGGYL